MPGPFQVAFDCADVEVMVHFWEVARADANYHMPPPPPGFSDWTDYALKNNIPREEWAGSLVDPNGTQPTIYFQLVPEGKTAKNRLHLDIPVGRPWVTVAEKRDLIDRKVKQLKAAGASTLYVMDEGNAYWVTMAGPECNEFCVVGRV